MDLFEHTMRPQIQTMQRQLGAANSSLKAAFDAASAASTSIVASSSWLQGIIAGIALLIGAGLAMLIGRGTTRRLEGMTEAMIRLASGDKTIDIPSRDKTDEIGSMARAVEVFRENAITADRLAAEQEAGRAARAQRQDAMDHHTQDFGDSVSGVITSLAGAADGMRTAAEAMAKSA